MKQYVVIEDWDGDGAIRLPDDVLQEMGVDVGDTLYLLEEYVGTARHIVLSKTPRIPGFQAGTPDFSGKLAKPVLVRVVAKQLFYGTGTPLAEIPGLHSQNMRDKPCRIVSAAGNFACDLFRQNFRGFRLTTPSREGWPSSILQKVAGDTSVEPTQLG